MVKKENEFLEHYLRGKKADLRGSFPLVRKNIQGKVLDVACANGDYLRFFSDDSVGVDISEVNVDACKKVGLNAFVADVNTPLGFPDGSFDTVFVSHVLEHVENPVSLLKEANRLLKPGCVLILGLPLEDQGVWRLRRDYFGAHPGHLYSFSDDGIKALLDYTGFEFEKFIYTVPIIDKLGYSVLHKWFQFFPGGFLRWICPDFWVVSRRR